MSANTYRGRLAPSPTGYLHLGHMRTFGIARDRAKNGTLILRNEDLDPERSREKYAEAMLEDLEWMGISWDEGPFKQSERGDLYNSAFTKLQAAGCLYPCPRSRKELEGLQIYPEAWRDEIKPEDGSTMNWRFRVPSSQEITFYDENFGQQHYIAGKDFGDFVVWRKDNLGASYELAVVVDDSDMRVTEVVRGADLLESTAKQILLLEALKLPLPKYYHCKLVRDDAGKRLAKRHDSLSVRELRKKGMTQEEVWTLLKSMNI